MTNLSLRFLSVKFIYKIAGKESKKAFFSSSYRTMTLFHKFENLTAECRLMFIFACKNLSDKRFSNFLLSIFEEISVVKDEFSICDGLFILTSYIDE